MSTQRPDWWRNALLASVLALMVIVLAACGGDGGPAAPTPPDPAPQPGALSIAVEPSALPAPWVLTGPEGFRVEGLGTTTLEGLAPGSYETAWGELTGWAAPSTPASGTLEAGGTLTLEGTYVPVDTTGTVVVSVVPEESNGAWRVVGPDGPGPLERGSRTLEELSPGSYTLRWVSTQGWELPDPVEVTFTLAAGDTRTVEGFFRAPSASLDITLRPAAIPAPWRLTDPFGTHTTGAGAALLRGLQSGRYRMTWLDVLGWTTPPMVEIEIAEGERSSIQGLYPLMPDPWAAADSLDLAAPLGGPLLPPDQGQVLLEAPLAVLDPEGAPRFFTFTSEPNSFIAIRLDPLASYGYPLDAQDLGIRLWRQNTTGEPGWTLLAQVNLSPRGFAEIHSPILYAGSGYAGDGTWALEVYSTGERTGRQLFRARVSNQSIPPP